MARPSSGRTRGAATAEPVGEGKMAKYYVQEFKCGNGNTVFYGEQTEHNHGKSNEFSKAAIDWLVKNAKWAKTDIESGKFKSGQNKQSGGAKQLEWKKNNRTEERRVGKKGDRTRRTRRAP